MQFMILAYLWHIYCHPEDMPDSDPEEILDSDGGGPDIVDLTEVSCFNVLVILKRTNNSFAMSYPIFFFFFFKCYYGIFSFLDFINY